MEQKFKSFLYIKIPTFILLTWMCYFYIYMSRQSKSLVECYNQHRRLYAKNYRLLAIYKQDKDSSIVYLKKEIPNRVNNINDIFNNEKYSSGKTKQLNGSSQGNKRRHQKDVKNKSCIFEKKKYSHLEKKIFKELDYVDFLKNNKTISDKIYKKIMIKKCVLRVALPLLLFLVLAISFILDNFCKCGFTYGLLKVIILISPALDATKLREYSYLKDVVSLDKIFKGETSPALAILHMWLTKSPLKGFTQALVEPGSGNAKEVRNYCMSGFLGFLIYFVPIFILSIILISGLVYYHKKVKKYEKIRFKKR
ncbi:fam-l protein [Plasmodium malariae]|uniref:Fam-l protein n=1 Tax=Plasmodium malariae TaxID=5858 RepID=A0A1D3RK48_PLAMA|nr:fam-l protein [Plasmodium malariae]SCN45361.1 fam-l protein [Plasmodium malariae]